jgi:hypothetical protein
MAAIPKSLECGALFSMLRHKEVDLQHNLDYVIKLLLGVFDPLGRMWHNCHIYIVQFMSGRGWF